MAVGNVPSSSDRRTRIEPSPSDSLVAAIVEAVASVKGVDPDELDTALYESVDPDALDALYRHAQDQDDPSWSFALTVEGVEVVVRSDGSVSAHAQGEGW